MQNIEMSVEKNILTLKVDISKRYGPSASGKTIILATTAGNISIPDHNDIKIGLNIYTKNKEA